MAVPGVVREHYLKAIGALIERYRRELGAARHRLPAARRPTSRSSSRCWRTSRRGRGRSDAVVPLAAVPGRRAGGGGADRAAPAEARARGAREVRRGAAAASSAPVEHTEKRHLRELLLLALRVAALLLLALAFARPFFATGAALGSSGVTIVALDTSLQHVGARPVRAREAAREGRDRARAGRRSGRRRDLRRRGARSRRSRRRIARWRRRRSTQAAPGFGATRYRAALSAAAQTPRRPARAPSSSSPTCRRAAGTPATARRCRRRRRSRSPTSARRRRTWR